MEIFDWSIEGYNHLLPSRGEEKNIFSNGIGER
jgi:hypothetical protein